jgi:hypothetical protein
VTVWKQQEGPAVTLACPKCREPLPAGTPACEVDSVTYCEDHAKTTTLFDHVMWRDQP